MHFKGSDNNKNNKNLDNTFKDGLRNMNATPDPEMWDKINNNLNADLKKRKYNHWYIAALFLLLPMTLTNIFINYDLEKYYTEFAIENLAQLDGDITKENIINNNPVVVSNNSLSNTTELNITTERFQFKGLSNGGRGSALNSGYHNEAVVNKNTTGNSGSVVSFFKPSNDHTSKTNRDNSQIYLASLSPDFIDYSTESDNNSFTYIENNEISDVLKNKDDFKQLSKKSKKQELDYLLKGVYTGASIGVQKTNILRRAGQFAPILGDNVQLNSSFSFSYGARVGWNFNRYLALEAGVYKSDLEMNYLDNRYNKIFTEGNIKAQYIEFPIALKFRYAAFNSINHLPHLIGINTGFTYAHLRNANVTIVDTEVENAYQYFDPSQLALNVGLDYEWFVHKNISLTASASAAIFSSKGDFPKFSVNNAKSDLRTNYRFQVGMNFILPLSR